MRALCYSVIGLLLLAAAAAPRPSFTAAQATAGEPIYNGSCAQCHGVNLEGAAGPALAGSAAKSLQVDAIFSVMTTTMPINNPGSLSHDQYVKVMAYILKRNGVEPSTTALTFSAASNAKVSL
jgi:polar amino acid transport system substrate-binding protein